MNQDKRQTTGDRKKSAIPEKGRKEKGPSGRVSIIMLNFNGGDYTSACLHSLAGLSYPSRKIEIIVVDNASSDGSAERIAEEFPGVKLIRNKENVGFSSGANLGASEATGEYLAFLNNDMKVDREWLAPLVAGMQDQVGCTGSVIRNWDGSAIEFAGRRGDAFAIAYSAATVAPPEEEVEGGLQLFVSGGAMLVRADLFRQLGGFDPAFFLYQEDVDLCWRIWLSGHSCVLIRESIAFHAGGASSRRLSSDFIQGMSQANSLATIFKNMDDSGARELLPLMVLYLKMRSADVTGGDEAFERAISRFRQALPALVDSRSAVQASRVRSDSELWAVFGHPLAFLETNGSLPKISDKMMRGWNAKFPLNDSDVLHGLVEHWVQRAGELITTCEAVFSVELERLERMRRLETAARDAVIRERNEAIRFLKGEIESRESSIELLRRDLERLEGRTKDFALLEQTVSNRESENAILRQQVELLSEKMQDLSLLQGKLRLRESENDLLRQQLELSRPETASDEGTDEERTSRERTNTQRTERQPTSRDPEVAVLQQQLEILERKTLDYGSYVKFAKLVAGVARDLGVGNLHYDPRSNEAPRVATNQTLTTLEPPGNKYDILSFSIIDWEFRWQRPQQLMSQFADHGHRVFYISIARMLPIDGNRCAVRPLRDNVWEVQLSLPERVNVYGGDLSRDLATLIVEDLRALANTFRITTAVSIVQVATWAAAAYRARAEFGWPVVYDCMDEWDTFPGMSEALLTSERRLVLEADLVVVTAAKLYEKYESKTRNLLLARNGADFERFHRAGPSDLLEDVPHPIVGYFGAIADWFDLDLMVRIAREHSNYSFVLIGGVFGLNMRDLEDLPNVHILGQQPYEKMPAYLFSFDACIIPFKVNAVTEATDPVKFYEFISQGKPVVSTVMPELYPYADLLYIASSPEDFSAKLGLALRENDPALRARRIEVARQNTWTARYEAITSAIAAVVPRVSIIVVTYHNLAFTRECIRSVFANTLHPNFELIIVDNASTDGTIEYLRQLEQEHQNVRVILNQENAGFARANNQGLAIATGDFLILLNNDTVVPRGWLSGLLRHLGDPEVGLVNSVTNFSGNESRIDVTYSDMAGMEEFAARYTSEHAGEMFDIRVAAMYCVAMRRNTFEAVGPLDETFGVGMFEDDDYSHRMRLAGYRVVCAEDSFVHHFGQASFKKLDSEAYQKIWDENQTYFQKKWNMPWQPHVARDIRSTRRSQLPERAAVEMLFVNMARSREIQDLRAANAAEVLDLRAHVTAGHQHVQDVKYLLQLEQRKVHEIHQSKVFRLAQIYWRFVRLIRRQRPDGSPALTADSFAPAPNDSPAPAVIEAAAGQPDTAPDRKTAVAAKPNVNGAAATKGHAGKLDLICFPIIEWGFRMQRPQQMMLQFAARGHRVFYVSHEIQPNRAPYESRQLSKNIFEVKLRGSTRDVFVQSMTPRDADTLAEGVRAFRDDFEINAAASMVQLPFWAPLALKMREEFAWPVIYDLMDNLAAFSTSPSSILDVEEKLMTSADLVVATSISLQQTAQSRNSNVVLVRNGCDYEHFARISPLSPLQTKKGRPLIGYYGAIADWFDSDLVGELASRHPEWDFVLIGSTVSSNVQRLRRLQNISFAGERPYKELPQWLERFDVAIIPFRITPLIEATNPVKAYEMLAGGKPIVSVPMPEVAIMTPLLRLASTVEEFETQIREAMEFDYEPILVEKRKAFARQNRWESRIEVLEPRIREIFGRALIILENTEKGSFPAKAVRTLLDNTFWANLEIVVTGVGTEPPNAAGELLEGMPDVRVSTAPSGTFGERANQILAESDADYVVVLSADVMVQRGWLSRIIAVLHREPEAGLVRPEVLNAEPGASRLTGFQAEDHDPVKDESTAPVFAMRRQVLNQIGLLDEDETSIDSAAESCSRHVQAANLKVVRARGAFVIFNERVARTQIAEQVAE